MNTQIRTQSEESGNPTRVAQGLRQLRNSVFFFVLRLRLHLRGKKSPAKPSAKLVLLSKSSLDPGVFPHDGSLESEKSTHGTRRM